MGLGLRKNWVGGGVPGSLLHAVPRLRSACVLFALLSLKYNHMEII